MNRRYPLPHWKSRPFLTLRSQRSIWRVLRYFLTGISNENRVSGYMEGVLGWEIDLFRLLRWERTTIEEMDWGDGHEVTLFFRNQLGPYPVSP